jgi:tripartite-type tricarboxylate transporter receptor subunit TctC
MRKIDLCILAALFGVSAATAQTAISFQGKTITMVIGFAAGGGTDAFGRLAATFLAGRLPGAPNVIVRNVPGAEGITAMNYVVQQVAPDGYTVVTAASTTADPLNYRRQQALFDPTTFAVIGGVGRGGSAILISREAERRLHDKQARPAIMGAPGGAPRSGMQVTAWGIEFLGWNARWIIGYRGTSDLALALERGEIDMTATSNLFLIQKLLDTGRFKILAQTGMLRHGSFAPRPELGDAPTLARLLEGKINDPLVAKAFEYWAVTAAMDKWLALPPGAPKAMVDVYRETYMRIVQEADFLERGKKISEDFAPMSHPEVEALIDALARTPTEAIEFSGTMLRKQGLEVQ